jgi:predicted phosphodiesterase
MQMGNRRRSSLAYVILIGMVVACSRTADGAGKTVDAPLARETKAVVRGVVFHDGNGNGRQDPGEEGVPGLIVHDEFEVIRTDSSGSYRLDLLLPRSRFVVVSCPSGYEAGGSYFHTLTGPPTGGMLNVDFPIVKSERRAATDYRFIAITDMHIIKKNRADHCADVFRRTAAMGAAFVINTGDICHNSAPSEYAFYKAAKLEAACPVFDVQGNHDGRFRDHLGPVRFSFGWGKLHFINMGNASPHDKAHKGKWLTAMLSAIPAGQKIVFLNHVGGQGHVGLLNARKDDLVAFLHGHGHAWRAYESDGVPTYMCGYLAYYGGFAVFEVKGDSLIGAYESLGHELPKSPAAKQTRWAEILKKYSVR